MVNVILKKPDRKVGNIDYYGVSSVSDILKVDPITVRSYIKKDYVRGIKIGHNWYISGENLEFFIINGKLKTRKDMSFQDYKTAEANFLTKLEANIRKAKKQIEKYRKVRSPLITENLMRRYEELKQALEEYKKNKMSQKDYDTFV
ncbi:DNA-binding protein [Candidatus Atribacteria bacterium 1244-E10-H5-B2]|nr:MAG: DNA-binding protein [Candidatus Atribacteria bacterium 1244-E10-H5-B2]